jgi:hypothetical protein
MGNNSFQKNTCNSRAAQRREPVDTANVLLMSISLKFSANAEQTLLPERRLKQELELPGQRRTFPRFVGWQACVP